MKTFGYLAKYVDLTGEVFLPAGSRITVKAVLSGTLILALNTYILTIRIYHPGGIEEKTITVVISSALEDEVDPERLSNEPQVMWLWITVVALALVVIGFIIFILRKKKVEEKDRQKQLELDMLEAEIIPPPPPPPSLPPMQNFQALPQYSGSFGYQQEKPQLARQSYAPTDKGEPKQLTATAGVRPSPSTEYIPPPPAVGGAAPAPSVVLPDLEGENLPAPPMKALPPAPSSAVQVPRIYAPPPVAPTPPIPMEEPGPEAFTPVSTNNKKYSFSRPSGKRAPPVVGSPSGAPPKGIIDGKTSTPAVTRSGSTPTKVKKVETPLPVVDAPSVSPPAGIKNVDVPIPVVDTPSVVPSVEKKSVNTSSPGEEDTLDALSRLLGDMPASLPQENTGKSAPPNGK